MVGGRRVGYHVQTGHFVNPPKRCVEVVRLVETNDIIEKMTYAFTNPSAADLVDTVEEWPGVTTSVSAEPASCCQEQVGADRVVAPQPRLHREVPSGVSVANSHSLWKVTVFLFVFLNTGDARFTNPVEFAAGSAVNSVAVGDFNGDGRDDIAIAQSPGITVLLGT